jgi:pimeloyl-ACP methyl ester carboxylesterase
VRLRGLEHHLTRWGPPAAEPLVFLHGFLDAGATFQFVVDAFARERAVLAPDLRGFGRSARSGADAYWLPDYLGDLEALLEAAGLTRATLIGHSLGGNLALLYAGIRPERVARVVNLEGVGLPETHPDEAPARYASWLDELRADKGFARHPSLAAFTAHLMQRNPRLTLERASFIARAWTEVLADGSVRVGADPAHRRVNPVLYRREEVRACWRRCVAPVLFVTGTESPFLKRLGGDGDLTTELRDVTRVEIPSAGHMLHHEAPEALAAAIEAFLPG